MRSRSLVPLTDHDPHTAPERPGSHNPARPSVAMPTVAIPTVAGPTVLRANLVTPNRTAPGLAGRGPSRTGRAPAERDDRPDGRIGAPVPGSVAVAPGRQATRRTPTLVRAGRPASGSRRAETTPLTLVRTNPSRPSARPAPVALGAETGPEPRRIPSALLTSPTGRPRARAPRASTDPAATGFLPARDLSGAVCGAPDHDASLPVPDAGGCDVGSGLRAFAAALVWPAMRQGHRAAGLTAVVRAVVLAAGRLPIRCAVRLLPRPTPGHIAPAKLPRRLLPFLPSDRRRQPTGTGATPPPPGTGASVLPLRAPATAVDGEPLRPHSWWAGRGLGEAGQTTAEYALVLLGAAAIALLVVAWATQGDAVGRLMGAIWDRLLGQVQ